MSLKVMIDKKANKVVFAEADKEFVGFLNHILSLPLSTAVRLVNNDKANVGCLSKTEQSKEALQSGNVEVEGVPYMVMDNLDVKPMTLSFFKTHLKIFDSLLEKHVHVGPQEGLAMLKAYLGTDNNNVLTTVFLGKKVGMLNPLTPRSRWFRCLLLLLCFSIVVSVIEHKNASYH